MNKSNVQLINETEVRKTINQLKNNGELFEIRVIPNDKKGALSGYFDDFELLVKAFDTIDVRDANVYITLNIPKKDVGSRRQRNKFLKNSETTNDKDIERIDWLFIDFDPDRISGISSTNEELRLSMELAQKVYVYLKGLGFEEPVKAFSGNGYHLLYNVGLQNTDENIQLIKKCLNVLSTMFSTDQVKVDTANFNPSRICKLYGTMAQKGTSTTDRPHRMSRLDGDIKTLTQTRKCFLEKLADEIQDEPIQPAAFNKYSPEAFDIETWMSNHAIRFTKKDGNGYVKYILDECPFDASHKAPDSMIIKEPSGAIGFKCLHNSCQGYHWQDLRKMLEPDAYEKSDSEFDRAIEEGLKRHNREKKSQELGKPQGKAWLSFEEIASQPPQNFEYIKTHVTEIDRLTHGLVKGGMSVWSGLRASAKSTLLSQIALHAVNDGHTVLFYSGEIQAQRFMQWIDRQAAGRQYVSTYEKEGSTYYFVSDDLAKKINKWIGNRFWVYDNKHGSDFEKLYSELKNAIIEKKPDIVFLDNLMTINIQDLDYNENRAQTSFMLKLSDLSKMYNIHIALVAHPKKTAYFLRLNDISGSINITNLVDQAFIVHRNNKDFQRGYLDYFGKSHEKIEDIESQFYSNVIEIAKDRDNGTQDQFVSLEFEPKSRQLLNEPTEVFSFDWTTEWQEIEKNSEFMQWVEGEDEDVKYN